MNEEKYTIEQVVDAITQASEEIMQAIWCEDRDMLKNALENYL